MQSRTHKTTLFICKSALVAAIYTALTMALAPISFGLTQVRIAEAMSVLPAFGTYGIAGLFIGCALSNLLGGFGVLDVVLGSLATLIAAVLARKLRKYPYLIPLPAVVVNAFMVGYVLHVALGTPYLLAFGTLFVEQAVACYALGLPLYYLLGRVLPKQ
ncbi:MAG: QueT transporter family protein [Christensenellales bacterium]|jgi:uncharacterized membrane protein